MSTETETPNTEEELVLDTPIEDDQDVSAADEGDEGTREAPPEQAAQPEDEEFVIEIDGELPEDETPLVKQLREEIRERNARIAELQKTTQAKPIEVGKKPDLWEDCDGDPDKFEAELSAWHERKRQAEQQERQQNEVAESRNREMQKRFGVYRAKAAALPVKDFEDAEKAVVSVLPDTPDRPLQQALLMYAEDPAKVVYALAKHPSKLAALAAETDPIKFVLNVRELERNLKVNNRRKPPAPEADSILRSTTSIAGSRPDKKLEELEKEAMRTGDMDKYLAYKRQLKQKAA